VIAERIRGGAFVQLRVRDNGVGIPPDMLPRLFDLFTQSDRTLDRADGGLGIGLTLVRRLTEMHGGKVTAASEGSDRGSEFVVELPLIPKKPRAASATYIPHMNAPTRVKRRVLVVDDNQDSA